MIGLSDKSNCCNPYNLYYANSCTKVSVNPQLLNTKADTLINVDYYNIFIAVF